MNWFEAFDLKTGQSYKVAEITEEVLNLLGPELTGSFGVGDFIVAPAEENSTFRFLTRAHFAVELLPTDSDGEHPFVPEQWHGKGYRPLSKQSLPDAGTLAYFRGVQGGEAVEAVGMMTSYQEMAYLAPKGRLRTISIGDIYHPKSAIFAWRPVTKPSW